MRLGSVFAVMVVGVGLGTAAVLVPLSGDAALPSSGWIANWDIPAIREFAARSNEKKAEAASTASSSSASSSSASSNVTSAAASSQAGATLAEHAPSSQAQDSRTFQYLSRPSAPAKAADAHVVDTPWTTQVSVAGDQSTRKPTSSKPVNDDQRRELVRQIQTELKRVGCYDGGSDGQWGGATRRAMGEFTQRVNASLPYDEPDLILLTLVKGQRTAACGQACPSGQTLTDAGRCLPSSVIAHSDRNRALEQARLEPQGKDAGKGERTDIASAAHIARGSVDTAWTTTTVRTPIETSSIAALVAPPYKPSTAAPPAELATADALVRPAPLPGRMAIGAPLPPVVSPEPIQAPNQAPGQASSQAPVTASSPKPDAAAVSHARRKTIVSLPHAPVRTADSNVVRKPVARPRQQQYSAQRAPRWQESKPFWWW